MPRAALMRERTKLAIILAVFAGCWLLPTESTRFTGALQESLRLVRWYAREHVLLCLVPAFFIAGAIGVFVSKGAVMKYLGPQARRAVAYPVAAASGTVLAVCSCTVLPLFASIYQRGAGLGPASAFLYSGPAINAMAIILTARVLGVQLGAARAVGAVAFAVVVGILMQLIFSRQEAAREAAGAMIVPEEESPRQPWQVALVFAAMVGILVLANLGAPGDGAQSGAWAAVLAVRWWLCGLLVLALAGMVWRWFQRDELEEWVDASWDFAKQILPLLLAGVAAAGLLLGSPGNAHRGLVPGSWISSAVGGSSPWANLLASLIGALMYFATLTEVPILEGLLASGMGPGPALALLLAGPALSLPNMLVIRSVLGNARTATFVALVVLLSTAAGMIYGMLAS